MTCLETSSAWIPAFAGMTVGLLIGSVRMQKLLNQTERCKIVVIPANAGIPDQFLSDSDISNG